jgi:hypothetical protein
MAARTAACSQRTANRRQLVSGSIALSRMPTGLPSTCHRLPCSAGGTPAGNSSFVYPRVPASALVLCSSAVDTSIFPVHLTVCPQGCRSQAWASMRRLRDGTHELACPQLVVSQG